MQEKVSGKKKISFGILLFSMFFGSGNLIFPPYMGFEAGSRTWLGLIGFSLTAIVFPVLGVIAIARNDSLMNLAGKVNRKFALIFSIIVFLSLGPGLAIPRNAAVSFEMAVVPFVDHVPYWSRILYSLVFFMIAFVLSVHPEKLNDWLGKVLGPILIGLMLVIACACFLHAPGALSSASGKYESHQIVQGFMDGYNTMDTLAALNFGNIIALNIMNEGIHEKKKIVRCTMNAGITAGILLLIIYAALAFVGALSGGSFLDAANGANVLTNIVYYLFGNGGVILLGIIYVLSCLTTCVGLLCSCAEYFASITKIGYSRWVILFSLSGCIFSIAGLDQLLKISVPFLNAVYPIAMVLVILGLLPEKVQRYSLIYPCTVVMSGFASVVYALQSAGIVIPCLTNLIMHMPPNADLCWLIPSFIGFLAGIVLSFIKEYLSQRGQSRDSLRSIQHE